MSIHTHPSYSLCVCVRVCVRVCVCVCARTERTSGNQTPAKIAAYAPITHTCGTHTDIRLVVHICLGYTAKVCVIYAWATQQKCVCHICLGYTAKGGAVKG